MTENNQIVGSQPVIISLNVSNSLQEKLLCISQSGLKSVEILSSDTELLKQLMSQYPDLYVGAGGITNTDELENCYHAGVHFVTSPGFLPAIVQTAAIYSVDYIPGIASLSEAMQVFQLGIRRAKPCPADLQVCTLINKYLPTLSLYPAELDWQEASNYLNLPSVSALTVTNPDLNQITALSAGIIA